MSLTSSLKLMGKRIWKSNNRPLGTLFGCMAGCIVGTTLVVQHSISIALVGNPVTLPYQIIAVLLATGTGGNLSSYIGASVDILTGEKTVFDVMEHLYNYCYPKKTTAETKDSIAHDESQGDHPHFPFITSSNEPGSIDLANKQPSTEMEPRNYPSSVYMLSHLTTEKSDPQRLVNVHADRQKNSGSLEERYLILEQLVKQLQNDNQQLKEQLTIRSQTYVTAPSDEQKTDYEIRV